MVIVGGKDVQSVEMTLVYDPRLVEVTDAAAGALLTLDGSPVQTERTAAPGRVRIRFARATPVSGSGQVLALTLRGAQAGASPITVESLRIGRPDGTSETPQPPAAGRLVVAP